MRDRPEIKSALDLISAEYPEPIWAVPNMIPEGLTVLAGKPKIGKSWLLMSLGIAIAEGGRAFGHIEVDPGRVLMLCLEDSERRAALRLTKLLNGSGAPHHLHVVTRWPRLDQGGLEYLAEQVHGQELTAVFIDTYARVKKQGAGRNVYDEDSEAAAELQKLGQETGTSIVVAHHLNQSNQEDWTERFQGSTGLIGVADTLAGIFRDRGEADAVLRLVGRDIEEQDIALKFDPVSATWQHLGNWHTYQLTEARRVVLEAVTTLDGAGVSDIATFVEKDVSQTYRILEALSREGFVTQPKPRGPWYPSQNGQNGQNQPSPFDSFDSFDRGGEKR